MSGRQHTKSRARLTRIDGTIVRGSVCFVQLGVVKYARTSHAANKYRYFVAF